MNINNEKVIPSFLANSLGGNYSKQLDSTKKKELGQFFTPVPIAKLMASFSSFNGENLSILDPGCGTAVLSCSLIEKLLKNNCLTNINLTAYETDTNAAEIARTVLDYLKEWLLERKVLFTYNLFTSDFILDNSQSLKIEPQSTYDIIISNPPYFKMSKDDPRVIASSELVSGQPNIYSLFMGISSRMLKKNGEMIFITPRSFASGNYFRAFRTFWFDSITLERVHLFASRTDAFRKDKILQELVITKARNMIEDTHITLSSCAGLYDIDDLIIKEYPAKELLDLNSIEKILHLPSNELEENVLSLVKSWSNSLSDYNINISTGKVVSFRAIKFIQEKCDENIKLVPLFWLHNVNKMVLEWPLTLTGKGQYIVDSNDSASLLIPNRDRKSVV